MRKLALIALVVVLAALALLLVRTKPRGEAIVFRRGDDLTVRTTPLYLRPVAFDSRCRAATAGDRLLFDRTLTAVSAAGDDVSAHVRFAYPPPTRVPVGWGDGTWCEALDRAVSAAVMRSAGGDAEAAIERELAAIRPASVSARIKPPQGMERLITNNELASRARRAPPVIVIGLDGADWELLDDYMRAGAMPALARLVREGAGGILETEHPPLSPIIWTTMMTGVSPLDHDILDFTRFNPFTHDKEPITSDERRAPAIWNMLTAAGKSASQFGLWATYAAEPLHGVNVTDRASNFLYAGLAKPAGIVYPPAREPWLQSATDAAERDVDAARMRGYLPSLTDAELGALKKVENPYAQPDAALRRILVESETYRRLATDFLAQRRPLPDLTIVYFQGTDTIGHVFAPFAPPKQSEVSQADYERFHDVPERYFRAIDVILGQFIGIAQRGGARMVIVSDHGFRWREGRPIAISSVATATAAKWHRNEGIYLMWGPGIAAMPNHPLRGGVRQVCATLLALTGMPAAAVGTTPLAPLAASPDSFDYRRAFTPAASPPPPPSNAATDEAIAKLRAIGYIGSGESPRAAVDTSDTKTAGAFNNEGLILRNEHRIDDALRAFERALEIDPRYASAMWNESETLFDAGRDLDRADKLLIDALRNGLADGVKFVVARSIAYNRTGRAARSLALVDAAVAAKPDDAELRLFRGRYRMDRRDCAGALEDFRVAQNTRPNDALVWASTGLAQMCLGDQAAAQQSLARARALDPRMPLP